MKTIFNKKAFMLLILGIFVGWLIRNYLLNRFNLDSSLLLDAYLIGIPAWFSVKSVYLIFEKYFENSAILMKTGSEESFISIDSSKPTELPLPVPPTGESSKITEIEKNSPSHELASKELVLKDPTESSSSSSSIKYPNTELEKRISEIKKEKIDHFKSKYSDEKLPLSQLLDMQSLLDTTNPEELNKLALLQEDIKKAQLEKTLWQEKWSSLKEQEAKLLNTPGLSEKKEIKYLKGLQDESLTKRIQNLEETYKFKIDLARVQKADPQTRIETFLNSLKDKRNPK